MKLTRAFVNLLVYRILPEDEPGQDIQKNAMMLFGDAFRRCNYISTVEGTVISYLLRRGISNQIGDGIGKWISFAIVAVEMLVNLLDDFVGYQLAIAGFKQHMDFYNVGLILGRFSKSVVAFYM